MLRVTAMAWPATSLTVQSAHGDGRSHALDGTRASVCSRPNIDRRIQAQILTHRVNLIVVANVGGMQQRQRVAQLSTVPLFANCSKRELSRLLSRVRTETVDAGHTLFVEGAPSSNLYVILTGSAVVRKNGRRVARVGPGDVVGELSVILGGPRTATVEAETPIEWLVLDRASLREAIDEVPGLGWNVLQSVASRLDEANKRPV